ncbi:hypothetical protein [Thiomonas intermedia]|uniref:hypothetical protein n=1 Tax=Thiomonas intermedia TaxID=926 RepID=UPI0012AC2807|nr:hypothetical protein [Thiomonas intermedia]
MSRSLPLAAAVGAAMMVTLGSAAQAATNPFAFSEMPPGHLLKTAAKEAGCGADDAKGKALPDCTPQMRAQGKCGSDTCKAPAGQCGAKDMADKPAKHAS